MAALAASTFALALARTAGPFRRVRPSDPGWPTQAQWQQLRDTVGGNLVAPQPMAAACGATPTDAACAQTMKDLQNPFFIGDHPAGTQVSGWHNAWTPQASACVVAARSAADVAAAVNFARQHRLRVAIKGGGHSYQGTSNAADSLLIWTRAMNRVVVHDSFVPAGCASVPVPAVTVEAGAMWSDAYDAVTTKAGRYVQGGGCTSVGVAGLVQSGGFGSFSKRFGTAAGSLLETEVVTADGQIRIANRCRNPDLFFAIRGGGGGSFGVVTKLTLRTYDLPEFFGAAHISVQAASDAAFRTLLDKFMSFYSEALFNPHWGESIEINPDNVFNVRMVCQGLSAEQARATFKPFIDWVQASSDYSFKDDTSVGARGARDWWDVEARRKRGSKALISDERTDAPIHHAWWSGDQEQVGAFIYGYESAWLPAALLRPEQRRAFVEALFRASRHMDVALHFNKGLAGAPPEALALARETATNPGVLDAFALAIIATGGATRYPGLPNVPDDLAAATDGARKVDLSMAELLRLAPNAGSYVSESNYFNPRWGKAFWGTNYDKLRAIKAKIDPDGLFFVHHGVESEDWSEDGFIRRG